MRTSIPILKLSNGVPMPALGFGTYDKEEDEGKTYAAVTTALNVGYRHLDCASYYYNEDEVGSALRDFLAKSPSVKRSDIFVTTKVWPHLSEPEDVEGSLNASLESLRLDYVDSVLIHWPFTAEKTDDNDVKEGPDGKYLIKRELTKDPEAVWRVLEKLYKAGKAKSIGVSNWTIGGLKVLLKCAEIKPAVNQVEIHPFLPNTELVEYCFAHDILPVAYSPLGSQHQVPSTGEKVTTDPELNAIAKRMDVTLVQLLISWGLRRGYAVLPKSSDAGRIERNFEVVELTDADFEAVNKVARSKSIRFVDLKETFGYDVWSEEPRG